MNEFRTLFEMKENINWDTLMFTIIIFVLILGLFIFYLNDKTDNRKASLSSVSIFLFVLLFFSMIIMSAYQTVLAQKDIWSRYEHKAYKVITGRVNVYKVGIKSKRRYEYFILNGITFHNVYASPNPTNFDDTIFYKNSTILKQNLTIRISYIEHVKGMIGNAIVKFEVQDEPMQP